MSDVAVRPTLSTVGELTTTVSLGPTQTSNTEPARGTEPVQRSSTPLPGTPSTVQLSSSR